jgi:hypothetical protein
MPGMLDCHGRRWLTESPPGGYPGVQWAATEHAEAGPALPDLTDPATRGCLRALADEAWAKNGVVFVGVEPADRCDPTAGVEVWLHWMGACNECFHGATEAEALVLALEAAPVSP